MDSEQSNHEQVDQDPATGGDGNHVERTQSRRKFARNAAVGSAVLLTLGNRVAWGSGNQARGNKVCVSQHAWESYVAGGRSSSAPTDGLDDEIDTFSQYVEQGKVPELKENKDKYCVNIAQNQGDDYQKHYSPKTGSQFDNDHRFSSSDGRSGKDNRWP